MAAKKEKDASRKSAPAASNGKESGTSKLPGMLRMEFLGKDEAAEKCGGKKGPKKGK